MKIFLFIAFNFYAFSSYTQDTSRIVVGEEFTIQLTNCSISDSVLITEPRNSSSGKLKSTCIYDCVTKALKIDDAQYEFYSPGYEFLNIKYEVQFFRLKDRNELRYYFNNNIPELDSSSIVYSVMKDKMINSFYEIPNEYYKVIVFSDGWESMVVETYALIVVEDVAIFLSCVDDNIEFGGHIEYILKNNLLLKPTLPPSH